ncbi:MAG: methylated-DNA--[protein]-cysteine S-methyltransferase [Clostridia bacterium]
MKQQQHTTDYNSPIGKLYLTATRKWLNRIDFERPAFSIDLESTEFLETVKRQLDQYFMGIRHTFDIPLAIEGTAFQKAVYEELERIPYGVTKSYKDIARMIGNPNAMRAVGTANHVNPIPIIVPCHRVVGIDGNLTGYAYGIEIKKTLLELEKRNVSFFQYGSEAIGHLRSIDDKFKTLVDELGMLHYELIPDRFQALVYNIIAQQIATNTAKSIWIEYLEKFERVTPNSIASADFSKLSRRISAHKARAIQWIASEIISGHMDLSDFNEMSDEAVVEKLCCIDKVGRWTAQMFLIFTLERQNVLSFYDYGIRRGLALLYNFTDISSKNFKTFFEDFREKASPYGTIASFYLWNIGSAPSFAKSEDV